MKVIPIMTHPGIELTGKKVLDAVTDGQVHFEAVKALHGRFPGADAATTIMDLTVEAEAFGSQIVFSDNDIPTVEGTIVSDMRSVATLQVPDVAACPRVQQYLLADRLCAAGLDKPVYAGCIGPFSLAGRLYGMTEIMMGIYLEPDTIRLLLDKCTEFLRRYVGEIRKTGVAGVVMAEPASGLLSNEDCSEFCSKYVKTLVEELQDKDFEIILHNCGNTGHCTAAMIETGAAGYHFGNRADMLEALQACPPDVPVMGNIDPVGVMQCASPDEVAAAVRELVSRCAGYPNFVLSTGCDTPPAVPFENIEAFYSAAL